MRAEGVSFAVIYRLRCFRTGITPSSVQREMGTSNTSESFRNGASECYCVDIASHYGPFPAQTPVAPADFRRSRICIPAYPVTILHIKSFDVKLSLTRQGVLYWVQKIKKKFSYKSTINIFKNMPTKF